MPANSVAGILHVEFFTRAKARYKNEQKEGNALILLDISGVFTSKKFQKNQKIFAKSVDKRHQMWYNIYRR